MDIHRLRARVSELQQALAVAKEQIRALALEAEAEKQDVSARAAKSESVQSRLCVGRSRQLYRRQGQHE